jgi:hypothetical protein
MEVTENQYLQALNGTGLLPELMVEVGSEFIGFQFP